MSNFAEALRDFDVEAKIFYAFNPKTLKMVAALLALNILTYIIFFTDHPLHNHGFRMPWIEPRHGYPHGRWFNIFLSKLTNKADIPAIVPLMAMLMCITSGLMALRLWKFDLSVFEKFIILGLLTTFPAYLSFYYFSWTTVLFMSGGLFALTSLYLCRELKALDIILGAIFFTIMMGSYQTSVSIFATVAAASAIASLITKPDEGIVATAKTLAARFIASALGLIGYVISVKITGVKNSYTASTDLSDLPARFKKVVQVSFEHLTITQPEFMEPLKTTLLILLVLAVLISLFLVRKSPIKLALVALLWLGTIIATKTMFLLSPNTSFFQYRYNLSMAFFHAFTAAVVIYGLKIKSLRSAALIFSSFILLRFVQADLTRQEVILRGQEHDLALANRILTRIENLPELDFEQTYDLIRVGGYNKYRETLLSKHKHKWETYGDLHMDDGRISAQWVDEAVFIHLGASVKFQDRGMNIGFRQKVKNARENFLENKKPWPDKSSVFIVEDKIIVYMQ